MEAGGGNSITRIMVRYDINNRLLPDRCIRAVLFPCAG